MSLTPEQQKITAVLAETRVEALEERPLGCAAVNSVIRHLADMWSGEDPAFDRDGFCAAANYRGMTDGTTGWSLLP